LLWGLVEVVGVVGKGFFVVGSGKVGRKKLGGKDMGVSEVEERKYGGGQGGEAK